MVGCSVSGACFALNQSFLPLLSPVRLLWPRLPRGLGFEKKFHWCPPFKLRHRVERMWKIYPTLFLGYWRSGGGSFGCRGEEDRLAGNIIYLHKTTHVANERNVLQLDLLLFFLHMSQLALVSTCLSYKPIQCETSCFKSFSDPIIPPRKMFKIKFEKQIIDLHCFQKVADLSFVFVCFTKTDRNRISVKQVTKLKNWDFEEVELPQPCRYSHSHQFSLFKEKILQIYFSYYLRLQVWCELSRDLPVVLCFHHFAMIRTCTCRHSDNESPQWLRSLIKSQIVLTENRFHIIYTSSVL